MVSSLVSYSTCSHTHCIYFEILSSMLHIPTVGSGIFVGLLGMAQFAKIHMIVYFVIVQIAVGIFEVNYV